MQSLHPLRNEGAGRIHGFYRHDKTRTEEGIFLPWPGRAAMNDSNKTNSALPAAARTEVAKRTIVRIFLKDPLRFIHDEAPAANQNQCC
jgi:hypothetical protein